MATPNLLINLPAGFYTTPALDPCFARLAERFAVRRASHDAPQQLAADLADADAVLMWSWPMLDDAVLDAAPRLRMAAQIDVGRAAADIALRRGLPVSLARGGFSPAVSEMALGLILSGLRKITDHQAAMRAGAETWVRHFPEDIDPDERELTGATVGLIGFGGVGRRLAELLAPFRCRLLVSDPFVAAETIAAAGGTRVTPAELAASAEVAVLCAASNAGTRHVLGAAEIEALRPGALLVNVARSALVDSEALLARLRRGDLYAALDVFDHEPLPADDALRGLPNVQLTPHRAGGILASVRRILDALSDDLEAFFAGEPRRWALTAEMLPGLDG